MKVKQIIALVVVIALLMTGSVLVTFAYLTSQDTVTNTFTVGKISMKLDEAKVDVYGVEIEGESRVKENTYKLLPGHTYTKDPTVTILQGSEECYVRMKVTVNNYDKLCAVFSADEYYGSYVVTDGEQTETIDVLLLEKFVSWNSAEWKFASYDDATHTYEFRYHTTVNALEGAQKLEPLFETITIPGTVANEALATLEGLQIQIVGHAMQVDGFTESADAAWNAFDAQMNANGGAESQG